MFMASTSAIERSRYCTARVCRLNRAPWHTGQVTSRSGRKFIATRRTPCPSHASQRPPFALKLKRPGPIPALPRLLGAREHAANVVPHAGVGGRVAPWRPADRRLIDFHQPLEMIHAAQTAKRRRPRLRAVQLACKCASQRVDDERAFAGTAHTRDAHKQPERDVDVDILQIVCCRSTELQRATFHGRPPRGGQRNFLPAR